MKVLSYNVRGLGGGEKRVEVRRLVQEKCPFVLCIQESKLIFVDDFMIKSICGDAPYGFSYQPSVGASGGLVTVWNSSLIDVWSSMSFSHTLIIQGRVILTGEDIVILNVYAPCENAAKRDLWERLNSFVVSKIDSCVCLCGDFNSVHSLEERKGRGTIYRQMEVDVFNKFIDDTLLIDLPICGCLYTWYRGDGISMSRLDRFLLSEKWCEVWPNCIHVAYRRGLLDQVPLGLHVEEANWGPHPLRMFKCWADYPGYIDFVRLKWSSFNVQGWGGFVLQRKFTMLKYFLKEWHQQHSQNLEGKISDVKNRISYFDSKGEVNALLEEEVKELQDISVNLHSMSRVQNSITWQKSHLRWLPEGDDNSIFLTILCLIVSAAMQLI